MRTTRTRNLDTPNSNAEKRETCLISTRRHIPRASLDALLVIRPLLVNERVAQLLLHFDISRIAAVCTVGNIVVRGIVESSPQGTNKATVRRRSSPR